MAEQRTVRPTRDRPNASSYQKPIPKTL